MFNDEDLASFYKLNFELMTEHDGFDLNTIHGMLPWERDINISMLLAKLQKQRENHG